MNEPVTQVVTSAREAPGTWRIEVEKDPPAVVLRVSEELYEKAKAEFTSAAHMKVYYADPPPPYNPQVITPLDALGPVLKKGRDYITRPRTPRPPEPTGDMFVDATNRAEYEHAYKQGRLTKR